VTRNKFFRKYIERL
uniref:Uncharacterized protein n=1 Tax=Globodera pallida TaxID=36090 RepID=A0A183CSP5_GLOPA